MNQPLILTFDIGSQSTRALLFDDKGNLINKKKIEYPPISASKPGYYEVDPHIFYDCICQGSNALYEDNKEVWNQIIGVSITTIRDTPVFLDENYQVVRKSILWLDQRVAKCHYRFPLISEIGMRFLGLYPTARAQAKQTRSNWLIEKEPENWLKIKHYWFLSTYLIYKFTGNAVDSPSYTIGHVPMNYRKQKWMKRSHIKYRIFNIEPEKLPTLVPTGGIFGNITQETADLTHIKVGLPLISSGSDKGCETIGTGAWREGIASVSFGTASSIQFTTKKYREPITFFPAYAAVIPGHYNSEIQVYRGFWMLSWFKRQFAQKEVRRAEILNSSAEEILNQSLTTIPPGCEGLMMHPYWGPMLKYPEAKGSLIGFSDYHTKAHVYRAIIEGISMELYHSMLALEKKTKQKTHTITLSGGGSQDDTICQINADIFGLPVRKIQTFETGGLGAALASFVALQVYPNFEEATKNMVHYTKEYQPNQEIHELYTKLYHRIYKKVYPRLRKLYKEIPEIIELREIE